MTDLKDTSALIQTEEKPFLKVIVHSFFIIPFLIAVFCVLLFGAVSLLTRESRTIYDYLNDVKIGGQDKRWQGAFELSRILANPKLIPHEQRFENELINAYNKSIHDDNRVRQYLALAMGRTQNPVFITTLNNNLQQEKEDNLSAIIYALGMFKERKAAQILEQFADHNNARIRSLTIASIGNIGDAGSKPILIKALNDSEVNVQWTAAISLAHMNDDSGKNVLRQLLNRDYYKSFPQVDGDEQTQMMLMALDAAKTIPDTSIQAQVKNLSVNDKNMKIRAAALKALNS